MLPISIVIITLNEEKNIKRCLDSVFELSDDIIVVDSGSTDKTEDICNKYDNVRFVTNKFIDYSQQRNFGSSLTRYNYILNIDADEELSETLKNSIKSLKINPESNILYKFNRLNHYCSKPLKFGGWYPDVKKKFWNKNYAKWTGNVHETLFFSKEPTDVKLKGDLFHYTYNSLEEHINQTIKYALLRAESDIKNKKTHSKIKLLFKPWFKFILLYFLKLGFLDGYYGFIVAKTSAFSDFIRISKVIKSKKIL